MRSNVDILRFKTDQVIGPEHDKWSTGFQPHLFKHQYMQLPKGLRLMEKWSEQVNYETLPLG